MQKALDDARVSERVLVSVRLWGRLAKGVRYTSPAPDIVARAYVMRTDMRAVRPDYELAVNREREPTTSEERFARTLLDQIGAEQDPVQRSLLESALFYGLDAFRLKEVVPAYEELGS